MNNHTETYDFLVSIIGNAPYGIVAVDYQGDITMCNEQALTHLFIGGKTGEIVEKSLLSFLGGIPEFYNAFQKFMGGRREAFDLISVPYKNKYLTIKARPIVNGMIFTTEDVTQVKEMEMNSLNAMLEGQESERRRIAKEIHDGIGPLMSTIKLNLDALRAELPDDKTTRKIEATLELVNMAASDIRSISHDLMPGALIDFGLIPALENLCQKASESGKINVSFFHSGMKQRLDQRMALSLYRIAQELLNNALKYSRSSTVSIQLIRHSKSLVLMVEDEGVGLDPKDLKELTSNGIGLKNVRTRVKSLNGTFSLESQPEKGVLVTIEIPLPL